MKSNIYWLVWVVTVIMITASIGRNIVFSAKPTQLQVEKKSAPPQPSDSCRWMYNKALDLAINADKLGAKSKNPESYYGIQSTQAMEMSLMFMKLYSTCRLAN